MSTWLIEREATRLAPRVHLMGAQRPGSPGRKILELFCFGQGLKGRPAERDIPRDRQGQKHGVRIADQGDASLENKREEGYAQVMQGSVEAGVLVLAQGLGSFQRMAA